MTMYEEMEEKMMRYKKLYNENQDAVIFLPYDADKEAFIKKHSDKAVIKHAGQGYAHTKYDILSNPKGLSPAVLASCITKGWIPFGYRTAHNQVIIHTD